MNGLMAGFAEKLKPDDVAGGVENTEVVAVGVVLNIDGAGVECGVENVENVEGVLVGAVLNIDGAGVAGGVENVENVDGVLAGLELKAKADGAVGVVARGVGLKIDGVVARGVGLKIDGVVARGVGLKTGGGVAGGAELKTSGGGVRAGTEVDASRTVSTIGATIGSTFPTYVGKVSTWAFVDM